MLLRSGHCALRVVAARSLATAAADGPMLYAVQVKGAGQGSTLLCKDGKEEFRFLVDQPLKMGGRNTGPNPLTTFLGGLLGCTQFTLSMLAQQAQLGVRQVAWETSGTCDLRTLLGDLPADQAGFQQLHVLGTVDCDASQEALEELAQLVERKCIVAATLKRVPGLELRLELRKGRVDADPQLQAAVGSS